MKVYSRSSILGFVIIILTICVIGPAGAQVDKAQERVFIRIEIKGMACPYCAYGMEKELLKVTGVEKVEIELKEGLAYISTPIKQKPSKEQISTIIKDAGFTIGQIDFSDTPFEKIDL